MKYFSRALKEAGRHWIKLGLALVCSLMSAALWSANIGAIFPILEATLQGDSLQTWNLKRVARAHSDVEQLQAQITALEQNRAALKAPDQQSDDLQLQMLRGKLQAGQYAHQSAEQLQPYFEKWVPASPFSTVLFIVSVVILSTLLKQVFSVTDTMLVSSVSQTIARDIRLQIFNKALLLDRPAFNAVGTSGFAAHITQITDTLAVGVANFYGGALNEPLRIVACLTGAMLISWRLTLLSLILAPLCAFAIIWLNRQVRGISRRFLNRSLGFHHVMLEVFGSLQTVQAFTMEEFERDRFRTATKELRRSAMLASYYNALASPLTEVFGIGIVCTAIAATSYLIIHQETAIFGITISSHPLSIPSMMVFFGLMIGAADPLRKLSGVITNINTGMAAANMLYPLLDIQSRIEDPSEPKPVAAPHHQLELRDVGFSYDGSHWVLQNVNLTVPFGQHVAILGPNGAGKSTLINLICRFFDPQQGEITLDGVPLKDLAIRDLRGRIALVTQQTELFNETILHNIRYGCWSATEEAVIEAARRARAHDFICGFSEGYQTAVGPNGQRLSGGQRQRIALARAILRNAEILILDEATSQIDAESEILIHDALVEYGRGRTMILISHRQSTLALATKVVQLDNGQLSGVELPKAKAA